MLVTMSRTIAPGFIKMANHPNKEKAIVDLSIIIVSWNVSSLLMECLQSLEATDVHTWSEVFVVDNASSDDTCQMVREKFPWVKLIESRENLGFSRGNNLALPHCEGEFVWLLNPDTVLFPLAVSKLVNFAKSDPRIGIVGPMQVDGQGKIQYEAAVNFPSTWNVFCDWVLLSKIFPRSRLFASRKMGYWDHKGIRKVPGIQGSAMLVRRQLFAELGDLDPTMFMVEDIDLCWRAKKAGWDIYYYGNAKILHYGGSCMRERKEPGRLTTIAFQSFWLFLRKHKGQWHARTLSITFGIWSALVLGSLPIFHILLKIINKQSVVSKIHDVATQIWTWSRCDKFRFVHPLADPPDPSFGSEKKVTQ